MPSDGLSSYYTLYTPTASSETAGCGQWPGGFLSRPFGTLHRTRVEFQMMMISKSVCRSNHYFILTTLGSTQKNQFLGKVCNLEFLGQQFKMCYTSVYTFTLTKSSTHHNTLWYLKTNWVYGFNKKTPLNYLKLFLSYDFMKLLQTFLLAMMYNA